VSTGGTEVGVLRQKQCDKLMSSWLHLVVSCQLPQQPHLHLNDDLTHLRLQSLKQLVGIVLTQSTTITLVIKMFHCPVTQSASSDKIRNSRKLLDKFRARPNTELSEMNQFTQSKSTMHYEKATLNVHNVSLRQMADAKNTELG